MNRSGLIFIGASLCLATGFAARRASLQQFNFQDPKGANGFSFSMEEGIEPVFGTGNDVTGTVVFDKENPAKSSGKIVIGMKSLKLTSEVMSGNMMGEWCLDAEKYPTASFEVSSAKVSTAKGNKFVGTVTGKFTVKDVTKEITVPVTATVIPNGIKLRSGDGDGDALQIKTNFSFLRSDYNIGRTLGDSLLSEKVDVKLHVVGYIKK